MAVAPDKQDPNAIDPVTGLKRAIQLNYTDPSVRYQDPTATPAPDVTTTNPSPSFAGASPNAAASGGADNWDANRVTQYFQSRGVTPFASSPDYWASKWNEWGKNDPTYFEQRLGQADEFTGVGPNYDWQAAGKADPGTSSSQAPAAAASGGSAWDDFMKQYQAQAAAEAAQKAEVRKLLMEQLAKAGMPVNESDQNIAAPLQAARDETARSSATERTALAERLYAQQGGGGLNSNALTSGIQQSNERNAGELSQLRANLLYGEYNARRQTMTQLLSQALAANDSDSARQIQVQIAALDAALKREGLGVNLAEFEAQLNQNSALAGAG